MFRSYCLECLQALHSFARIQNTSMHVGGHNQQQHQEGAVLNGSSQKSSTFHRPWQKVYDVVEALCITYICHLGVMTA